MVKYSKCFAEIQQCKTRIVAKIKEEITVDSIYTLNKIQITNKL